ncbi:MULTISPECIES: ABC transporter substrate-binding protein [unclassified Bradyrhizobium]|uniref:ABC transporter substrate-binding protein n=1 Tax=unclassified Bradyrhizobium TaxID=2631580 RepID=UPI00247AB2EC|nr:MULTISPECIES: ABC transporter substrate-binding protein [unclassified Bradyrhizobium]WGR72993.1 ABC transporter substrate-binding protein [Bradyrhizobium sp. ISRA426]WGR77828.1 ABC transporter substrate-binding protein [Bradyrhizobium sp. ISRA430]WGR88233.1 ABC transporter substrate-binding protein [Bradyrhizobium sp. ISRA432]
MAISRRDLMKAGVAAGTALSLPRVLRAQTAPNVARTARMVMGELGSFDPITSTTYSTGAHALAIYDMLFSPDSKLVAQPQMVGKWDVSDDRKTYIFELRDGLGWHDGTPVTASDCVASIRRWAQAAPGGQLIMERSKDISKKGDKIFTIALKEPLGLLPDLLASVATPCLFIMREKDADRPASEQVTANIGSGPFKFNDYLAKPGASFTYDRNEKYIPRNEPADGLAGGKVAKVDRVVWEQISDQQTAFAAIQAGEVDFLGAPPLDLLSTIRNDRNLKLEVMNKGGLDCYMRLNFLQRPFDNVKARQAMLHLVDQRSFLSLLSPIPEYVHPLTSLFGISSPYTNDVNTGWYKQGGDPEKARQLFNEAGYSGEKIVILQPTPIKWISECAQLVAAELRKIGINAQLAPGSWADVQARSANKGPVESGGWSIFISASSAYADSNPLINNALAANGDKAWVGWPTNREYETLRAKWADATLEERQALARKMQGIWWDFVGCVMLGQFATPILRRSTLTGLLSTPSLIPMWNMQKT